jgi:hypothetical protein
MTNAEAADLEAKWNQQGDPPPRYEHLSQIASLVVLRADGYMTTTYHCRVCGKAIVRTHEAPALSNKPLFD